MKVVVPRTPDKKDVPCPFGTNAMWTIRSAAMPAFERGMKRLLSGKSSDSLSVLAKLGEIYRDSEEPVDKRLERWKNGEWHSDEQFALVAAGMSARQSESAEDEIELARKTRVLAADCLIESISPLDELVAADDDKPLGAYTKEVGRTLLLTGLDDPDEPGLDSKFCEEIVPGITARYQHPSVGDLAFEYVVMIADAIKKDREEELEREKKALKPVPASG